MANAILQSTFIAIILRLIIRADPKDTGSTKVRSTQHLSATQQSKPIQSTISLVREEQRRAVQDKVKHTCCRPTEMQAATAVSMVILTGYCISDNNMTSRAAEG